MAALTQGAVATGAADGEAKLAIYGAVVFGLGFIVIAESLLWMLYAVALTALGFGRRGRRFQLVSRRAMAREQGCRWGRRNRFRA